MCPAPLYYITGTIRDLAGRTVGGAVLDVWQADPQGRYEAQVDTAQARLRGKYTSQSDGTYCQRTVAPLGYSIPMDGPVGQLLSRTGISHHRPAHVHFLITAPDYEPLITQLFEKGAPVPRLRRRVPAPRPNWWRGCRRITTSCCSARPQRPQPEH